MSILSNGILTGSGGGGGGGGGGGLADAPVDGKLYGRQNASWAAVENAKYRHIQSQASKTWNIQHNLGSKPVALWTYDSAGNQIFGEPDFENANLFLLTVTFSEAVTGTAYVHTLF